MSQHYFEKLIDQAAERIQSITAEAVVAVDELSKEALAGYIDHTLLKPEATSDDIITLCEEAKQYTFASVCVHPSWVMNCLELLEGSPVIMCSVVGFPLGSNTSETKALEAEELVSLGVKEIDMVLNVGRLKEKDYTFVFEDIQQVVDTAGGADVKVILETCLLNEREKIAGCVLSKEAGAHFVKTSTGFSKAGATVQDIQLMRRVVGPEMGVKAAGGIRDYNTAIAMLRAGATRIGASASVDIVS